MSPINLRNLGLQRNQQENRPGFVRVRILGSGNHGHHNRWKDTEVNHTHIAIHPSIQWEPQTGGLEGYGSSSSGPRTPEISIPMENGQQEVQPSFTLGRTGMILPEGWNPNRKFKLLEEREARIRENQANIEAIEEELNQKEQNQIPSGSQEVELPNSPVASDHSAIRRSVAKTKHSSQSQVLSRRRKGSKGKNKTSFNQRKKESDPMIQKIWDLVKEVQNSKK
ncbi:hypothetical protein O181_011046 [Austropuccinia psidii MF-1]|uniref:Uncharacterized protein n=1 Tax=Austropuccinia psidii MF-1 TaxID=1389203 RepID=A0A9Q3BS66_9BASI|nr:hypothetical protein [Austropuccinia psidii MF-1]